MSLNVFDSVYTLITKINTYFSNNNINIIFRDFSVSSNGQCHFIIYDNNNILLEFKNCEFLVWNIDNLEKPTIEILTPL